MARNLSLGRCWAGVALAASVAASGAQAVSDGPRAADAAFDAVWRDGRAELDGYQLTVDRYGHPRKGSAVLIYVTEPMSRSKHVKLDDPSKAEPSDVLDVLKLNFVRRFQTGIYDYHAMVSLFTSTWDFSPVKVAFSNTEWCGQVYEQLDFDRGTVAEKYFSYFENESAARTLPAPAEGIEEDDLFILLRGLRGAYLAPGASRTAPFLASPFQRRLAHRGLEWSSVTIERAVAPETVTVPAGSFVVDLYSVKAADGREGRFSIERAEPHRVIRWSWSPPAGATEHGLGGTDEGQLTGTSREPYWKEHDPGDEKYLEALGLEPAVSP